MLVRCPESAESLRQYLENTAAYYFLLFASKHKMFGRLLIDIVPWERQITKR
jgi:hypothetical protein